MSLTEEVIKGYLTACDKHIPYGVGTLLYKWDSDTVDISLLDLFSLGFSQEFFQKKNKKKWTF